MRQNKKNVSPMSNEGRNAYVIEHLTDALLNLMKEKSLNEISISELVDTAQVGRASFYRNYSCKEDILRMHIKSMFQQLIKKNHKESDGQLSEQLRILIRHFEKNQSFYKLLNEQNLTYLLKDVIIGLFDITHDCDKTEAYIRAFVAYSVYGWIDIWFQRGMKETADEIAEMFKAFGK